MSTCIFFLLETWIVNWCIMLLHYIFFLYTYLFQWYKIILIFIWVIDDLHFLFHVHCIQQRLSKSLLCFELKHCNIHHSLCVKTMFFSSNTTGVIHETGDTGLFKAYYHILGLCERPCCQICFYYFFRLVLSYTDVVLSVRI